MFKASDIERLVEAGGNVLAGDGRRIGAIGVVYVVDAAGVPVWVSVRTGLSGAALRLIPLAGARIKGKNLVVEYGLNQVKNAPSAAEDGYFDPVEEDSLCRYYGLGVFFSSRNHQ
jgi:hypothetical protein